MFQQQGLLLTRHVSSLLTSLLEQITGQNGTYFQRDLLLTSLLLTSGVYCTEAIVSSLGPQGAYVIGRPVFSCTLTMSCHGRMWDQWTAECTCDAQGREIDTLSDSSSHFPMLCGRVHSAGLWYHRVAIATPCERQASQHMSFEGEVQKEYCYYPYIPYCYRVVQIQLN